MLAVIGLLSVATVFAPLALGVVAVIFGFIGVTDLTFVRAEGLMLSPEHRQKGLDAALAAIPAAQAA